MFKIIKVELVIKTWEEDGFFFMYAPCLDIVGYGDTPKEAEESFHITHNECMRWMAEKNKYLYTE